MNILSHLCNEKDSDTTLLVCSLRQPYSMHDFNVKNTWCTLSLFKNLLFFLMIAFMNLQIDFPRKTLTHMLSVLITAWSL